MTARGSRGSSLAISVLVTLLAVTAAVVLVVRLPGRASETAGKAAAHPLAASATPAPASASATPGQGAKPTRARHRHRPPRMIPTARAASPSMTAPSTAPPARSASPASGQSAAVQQVLALINQARGQAGRPAYTISSGLDTSAGRHTAVMAGGCGLSHQCPGEPDLGARETAAGVHWTAAGENIGEGGPVAGTPAAIAQMAVGLTQSMLAEKPPDDGHRLNILSSAFTHVGISVYRDSSGTVWMTQDFSS
ncbi:MAG: polymerase, sigma-24 subunit, subfamily [Actinomycetia bacterium]|nr:polymerase, sigma-24 subunit, subfamily [Actinomycetes bacterium]